MSAGHTKQRIGPYDIGNLLGRGTIGNVHECFHRPSKTKMAIKVINKQMMVGDLGNTIKREIAILKLLKHPHVVSARDFLKDKTNVYIAMDMISGGELFNEITRKEKLSEPEARKYMGQLIDGLAYCHRQGICHRDLKPENLLLDKDKNLKITDFGVANFVGGDGASYLSTKVGSHDYVAPEVLTESRYLGQLADVWSCGVILFAMLAGFLPFEGHTSAELHRKICRADFVCPSWFTAGTNSLIGKILIVDPAKRIKIEDMRAEPWFEGTKPATHEQVSVSDEQIKDAFIEVSDTEAAASSTAVAAASAAAAPSSDKAAQKKRKKKRGRATCKLRDYHVFEQLGQGAFAKVFRCVHLVTDNEYAMKVVSKSFLSKKKLGPRMQREIAMMKTLKHPNVVTMREVMGSSKELFLVLELVCGGSIADALKKKGKIAEPLAKQYMWQLFDGLGYCHSRGVCHRDLKPDNLMLDGSGNIKIADFGLGNFVVEAELLYTRCGTPNYVAPEIIDKKGYVGQLADIWSCGVILFHILAGEVPFKEQSTTMLYKRIRGAEYYCPKWFSTDVEDLIGELLVPAPASRLTLDAARTRPWFNDYKAQHKTHAKNPVAPSEWRIATAIKPVLQPGFSDFGKRSPPPVDLAGHSAAVAADVAAPSTSPVTLKNVEIQHKKHKLTLYKSIYKNALVSMDGNRLHVVVNNVEIKKAPFPLSCTCDLTVSWDKRATILKLPRGSSPRYYRFVCRGKSEDDKDTTQLLQQRLVAVTTAPALPEAAKPAAAPPAAAKSS